MTINQVSADTDITNDTDVVIGTNATLAAHDVTVQAEVTKLAAYARAKSTTLAAGSDLRPPAGQSRDRQR